MSLLPIVLTWHDMVGTQWCWVLLLNSAHRLDLIGVCLGAVLIVASVLSLVSVPLKDVLISTVTGKLIAYPAAREKGKSPLLHRTQIRLCRELLH